jgi:hypothetical protein
MLPKQIAGRTNTDGYVEQNVSRTKCGRTDAGTKNKYG